jgi:N-acetylneuraminic acid mutarotase
MKKTLTVLFVSCLPCLLFGQWTKKADIPNTSGTGRWGALCFSVNNKVYVGGGYIGPGPTDCVNDVQEYSLSDTWKAKANLPGASNRQAGISFTINGKAYVGLGGKDFTTPLKDLWQYNETNDTWVKMADLPDTGRTDATYFVINNKAYVVGGITDWGSTGKFHATNDVWEYDPANNKWTAMKAYPGDYIYRHAAFSIGSKGYVAGGYTQIPPATSQILSDLAYEFDPVANSWTAKHKIPMAAQGQLGFSIKNIGYIGFGNGTGSTYYNKFYAYDPGVDYWTAVPIYSGMAGRAYGAVAVIGDTAYLGAGESADASLNSTYYSDWYKFTGTALDVSKTTGNNTSFICYPNPCHGQLYFDKQLDNKQVECNLFSITGQKLKTFNNVVNSIDLSYLKDGQYIVELKTSDQSYRVIISLQKD